MSFDYDGTGVKPTTGFSNLPKGWYELKVIEFTDKNGNIYPLETESKDGDPMVRVACKVVTPVEFEGKMVWHTVTFKPKDKKGAGMAIHWLKTIGQPWEGEFSVDSKAWVGSCFRAWVYEDEYQGKRSNKIAEVEAVEGKEEVPF